MSKTGRYKYNPETKEMEKISDDTPKVATQVWWPEASDHSGYTSEALGVHFTSKKRKREYMEKNNIAERGY